MTGRNLIATSMAGILVMMVLRFHIADGYCTFNHLTFQPEQFCSPDEACVSCSECFFGRFCKKGRKDAASGKLYVDVGKNQLCSWVEDDGKMKSKCCEEGLDCRDYLYGSYGYCKSANIGYW